MLAELKGKIERVTYNNEETGYSVAAKPYIYRCHNGKKPGRNGRHMESLGYWY